MPNDFPPLIWKMGTGKLGWSLNLRENCFYRRFCPIAVHNYAIRLVKCFCNHRKINGIDLENGVAPDFDKMWTVEEWPKIKQLTVCCAAYFCQVKVTSDWNVAYSVKTNRYHNEHFWQDYRNLTKFLSLFIPLLTPNQYGSKQSKTFVYILKYGNFNLIHFIESFDQREFNFGNSFLMININESIYRCIRFDNTDL